MNLGVQSNLFLIAQKSYQLSCFSVQYQKWEIQNDQIKVLLSFVQMYLSTPCNKIDIDRQTDMFFVFFITTSVFFMTIYDIITGLVIISLFNISKAITVCIQHTTGKQMQFKLFPWVNHRSERVLQVPESPDIVEPQKLQITARKGKENFIY